MQQTQPYGCARSLLAHETCSGSVESVTTDEVVSQVSQWLTVPLVLNRLNFPPEVQRQILELY